MRGIVILEVLRKLQEELGNSIPILDFFDLVVGTRYVFPLKAGNLFFWVGDSN